MSTTQAKQLKRSTCRNCGKKRYRDQLAPDFQPNYNNARTGWVCVDEQKCNNSKQN